MNWWMIYSGIGLTATLITAIATPVCRHVSRRMNFFDVPLGQCHKKHGRSTPLLGGVAMLLGWTVTVYAGLWYALSFRRILPDGVDEIIPGIVSVRPLLSVISVGAVALTIMGLLDDRKPLGPFVKFALQFLICAGVALYPKLQITVFFQSHGVTWLITVFWYMFIINAFNFFDNMDGLASGMAVIGGVLFTVVAAFRCQIFVAALGAATAGAALGFYLYNRYPASIFMGDSGSHFLGFMLAVIATLTLFYSPSASPTIAPILIPVLVLAVLIFDTFAVIVIRLRNRKPIYYGDHNHISHRFCRMGMSRQSAVFLVHLLSLTIGLGAITLLWLDIKGVVLVLLQSAALLLLVTILHRGKTD